MNILQFNLVIICCNLNFESILSLLVFNLGDLSLIASIAPIFLATKIGWIKFYYFRGLSIRCHQIVRESPYKILLNRKSSTNMDKKFSKPLLKFSQFQKDIQWTLSNSNSQGEFEFVRIMESSD